MLLLGGSGLNLVDHLRALFVRVGTLDHEAGKRGKWDCDEILHRNSRIYVGQVSFYTADVVINSQPCKTLGTVNSFARHNLIWKIRM